MSKITFTDKVALNENPSIPEINKMTALNVNELKNAINDNSPEERLYVVEGGPFVVPAGQTHGEDTIELSAQYNANDYVVISYAVNISSSNSWTTNKYAVVNIVTTISNKNYLTIMYNLETAQATDTNVRYKAVLLKIN